MSPAEKLFDALTVLGLLPRTNVFPDRARVAEAGRDMDVYVKILVRARLGKEFNRRMRDDLAEDAIQHVHEKFVQHRCHASTPAEAGSFVQRVAVNHYLDALRWEGHHEALPEPSHGADERKPDPEPEFPVPDPVAELDAIQQKKLLQSVASKVIMKAGGKADAIRAWLAWRLAELGFWPALATPPDKQARWRLDTTNARGRKYFRNVIERLREEGLLCQDEYDAGQKLVSVRIRTERPDMVEDEEGGEP